MHTYKRGNMLVRQLMGTLKSIVSILNRYKNIQKQTKWILESNVQSSFSKNCHDQMVFRINLKLLCAHPQEQECWYFNKTNTDNIKKAISNFQWERLLLEIWMWRNDFNKVIKSMLYVRLLHMMTDIYHGLIR